MYDPISRKCSLASAGHLWPALVTPDGTVDFLELPTGPPLGLGGLPFEAVERELPEGSLLALYTDGLVEAQHRDVNTGLQTLRTALADTSPSLETTCDRVLDTLLGERPADDVALLLARTRALDNGHVAVWDLPADPEFVAEARSKATAQLHAWGLDDLAYVTELVVSELVTNAIRYASAPVQLRLIKERTLICEVSDASSTAPTCAVPASSTRADGASCWSLSSPSAGECGIPAQARPSGPSSPSRVGVRGTGHAAHRAARGHEPGAQHTARPRVTRRSRCVDAAGGPGPGSVREREPPGQAHRRRQHPHPDPSGPVHPVRPEGDAERTDLVTAVHGHRGTRRTAAVLFPVHDDRLCPRGVEFLHQLLLRVMVRG